MNIEGGALSFESELNNDKLNKAIDESTRRVQGLSDSFVGTGDTMDEVTQEIVESIEIQKKVIEELETEVRTLDEQLEKLGPGQGQQDIIDQAQKAKQELEGEKDALVHLEKELENVSAASKGTENIVSKVVGKDSSGGIEEIVRRIQAMSSSFVDLGNDSDSTSQRIVEAINKQKNTIKELERGIEDLQQWQKKAPNDAQLFIDNQLTNAKKSLESARQELALLDNQLQATQQTGKGFNVTMVTIESAFQQIDIMLDMNKTALVELETEYDRLGQAASDLFMKGGNDDEVRRIKERQSAIAGEITVRKALIKEIQEQGQALSDHEKKLEEERRKAEEVANAHETFRTQLRKVREEMMQLEQAGMMKSERYEELRDEAARLTTAMQTVQTQANVLAHSQSGFQGVISAIGGVSGAFSAAQGTIGLFTDKNEDLQKVMLKVQSLMAITIGLQQVSTALHKNSAFQLVVVAKAKTMLAAATTRLSVALGISTVAAQALMATLTLGLSVAIVALITLWDKYSSSQKKAAEEARKFGEAAAEACYKPIGAVESLSKAWSKLGDNMKAKEKFVEDNKDKFDSLGVSVKNAAAAEKLLIDNKTAFIQAQIMKAKALAATSLASEKYKVAMEKMLTTEKPQKYVGTGSLSNRKFDKGSLIQQFGRSKSEEDLLKEGKIKVNPEYERFSENMKKEFAEANKLFETAAQFTVEEQRILAKIGLSANNITEGSIAALEQSISKLKDKYKHAASDLERSDLFSQITKQEALLKKLDKTQSGRGGGKEKDPFVETLNERKKQYDTFSKWMNSGDEILAKTARTEFASLLNEGDNYLDYLKKQREALMTESGKTKGSIGEEMVKTFGVGNVDLLTRPLVDAAELVKKGWEDAGEGIATVFSSSYGVEQDGKEVMVHVTPITPDGKVLSEAQLSRYIDDVLNGSQNILEADSRKNGGLGIVLNVDTDTSIEKAAKWGEDLHSIQEKYYLETENLSAGNAAKLKKINDAIAEETKKNVLDSFNEELQNQLNNARSIVEMLDIIEQKRKTLANDNTDIDNEKKDSLDEAQKNVAQQAKEETDQLLANYASYLTIKIEMERQFTEDMILLQKRLSEAQTDEERQRVQGAIDARKKAYQMESKKSGDDNYDKLVEDYRTFEQKKSAISEDFEEKRKTAKEHGNEELVKRLTEAEQKALSKLALDEVVNSSDWEKLFGNLDELTSKEIERLMALIQSNKLTLGVEFDPKDLETIKKKLTEAQGVLNTRNPFKALINGIKEYSQASEEEGSRKSLNKVFESASSSLELLKGGLDSVVGGLADMGLAGDEVTQQLLGDISKMIGSAGELASGLATSNPLSIIQGSVGLLTSAFDVFNIKDRKKEREIQKHKKAVEQLKEVYQDLERAVDKALGGDEYKNQKQMISNLRQQQQHFAQMAQSERDKKKTDHNKVKEYEQAYKDAGQKIEDIFEAITQDILQTNAKDFANQLGDAFVEAFGKGEDAAKSFGQTADSIMKQAVLNQLKKNFLEKQLQGALDNLERSMGHWEGDNFVFDGLTQAEQDQFRRQIESIGASFGEALKVYEGLFKDLTEEEFDTSLTGAVKGVSEETASLVAGQMNAIRIHQIESIELIRQQLTALNIIAKNTAFNSYLARLDDIVKLLGGDSVSDSLRSQGLS